MLTYSIYMGINSTAKDKCVIAVLHNLCETYSYSKEISVLPSRDLVESLEGIYQCSQ